MEWGNLGRRVAPLWQSSPAVAAGDIPPRRGGRDAPDIPSRSFIAAAIVATAAPVVIGVVALLLGLAGPPISVSAASATAAAAVATAVLGVGGPVLLRWARRRGAESAVGAPSIEDRLEVVTRSLRDASRVMADLEGELRARQNRLESISAEYEQVKRLANVNREAADAIRYELAKVVHGENRRAFWQNAAVTLVAGLALGVVAAVLGGLVLQAFAHH